jgi:inorganic triphosphatase YgiF
MERELKFLLEQACLPALPIRYGVANAEPTLHLLDEYLDARGQLQLAGWRLRRRIGDGEAVRYTLKSVRARVQDGPLSERIEIERTPEQPEAIPSEIAAQLAEAGIDITHVLAHLEPYLTLRQERTPATLSTSGGALAIISVDEIRAFTATPDGACQWTELEIEFLATASPNDRDCATIELTEWLAAQPGVTAGGEAKVDRAARLLAIDL